MQQAETCICVYPNLLAKRRWPLSAVEAASTQQAVWLTVSCCMHFARENCNESAVTFKHSQSNSSKDLPYFSWAICSFWGSVILMSPWLLEKGCQRNAKVKLQSLANLRKSKKCRCLKAAWCIGLYRGLQHAESSKCTSGPNCCWPAGQRPGQLPRSPMTTTDAPPLQLLAT